MHDGQADKPSRDALPGSSGMGRLAQVLAGMPELEAAIGGICAACAEAGLSNEVFRIDGGKGSFILRLERSSLRGRVDRVVEAAFARRAADLGLAPEVVFSDPPRGIMLVRALPEARPLSSGDRADMDEAVRLGKVLHRLHAADGLIAPVLDPVELVEAAVQRLGNSRLARDDQSIVAAVLKIAAGLRAELLPVVPSHCDPVPQNVLLSGGKLWLIDFEYARLADPAWDLAYAGLEAGYAPAARMALLSGYCAGDFPQAAQLAERVARMRPVCDVVSALWALDQAQQGNPATDFAHFARLRMQRAQAALPAATVS